ncbi:hypothetical protein [Altererythrobacter sp. ZODW24]|uniref:hypothetical protein n=1 Tax=Altererythrobacter sp. ZODW24 TaxID=2185142 RepID=UPI000DF75622|nr:hypothetical protein [Altererythrobacter sp. ZODW24]
MHLPPYFFEIVTLIFFSVGAVVGWLSRQHIIGAALIACATLFLVQCILHVTDGTVADLFDPGGPLVFYAIISALGLVPALVGAWVARRFQAWRAK